MKMDREMENRYDVDGSEESRDEVDFGFNLPELEDVELHLFKLKELQVLR